MLVQNLERLNDNVTEESDGIHNTLSIIENLVIDSNWVSCNGVIEIAICQQVGTYIFLNYSLTFTPFYINIYFSRIVPPGYLI